MDNINTNTIKNEINTHTWYEIAGEKDNLVYLVDRYGGDLKIFQKNEAVKKSQII